MRQNMKHLLEDGTPGERPSKRHSTSPPSAAHYSPRSPTAAIDEGNNTAARRKSELGRYDYTGSPGPLPSPTWYRGAADTPLFTRMEVDNGQETDTQRDYFPVTSLEDALNSVEMSKAPPSPAHPPPDDEKPRASIEEPSAMTRTVPLKDLRYPKACALNPHVEDEIFFDYLSSTTISFAVWVNYDAATKCFFHEEPRVMSCGKVYLSPRQRARLDAMDSGKGFELPRIDIDIGTPFRVLARLSLARNGQGRPTMEGEMCTDPRGLNIPHAALGQHIAEVMNVIADRRGWEGKQGFKLGDLDAIAESFVRPCYGR